MDYQNDRLANVEIKYEQPPEQYQLPPSSDEFEDAPCSYALLSYASVFLVLILLDKKVDCHADFSIQSITVYPFDFPSSSSMWRVHFLVTKPSSKCSIFYDHDYVSTKLGSLKSAVLNISHQNSSDGQTELSVTLAAEVGVITNVHDLDIKIPAMLKQIIPNDLPGNFHVHCRNLTIVFPPGLTSGAMLAEKKIECHSSFIGLKQFFGLTYVD